MGTKPQDIRVVHSYTATLLTRLAIKAIANSPD